MRCMLRVTSWSLQLQQQPPCTNPLAPTQAPHTPAAVKRAVRGKRAVPSPSLQAVAQTLSHRLTPPSSGHTSAKCSPGTGEHDLGSQTLRAIHSEVSGSVRLGALAPLTHRHRPA